MGRDSKRVRHDLGDMTQKEFSEYFGIPYRTVTNWDSRECMPDYVENIINMYIGALRSYSGLLVDIAYFTPPPK